MTRAKKTEPDNRLLLYRDEDGKTSVSVLFSEEDFWVTQVQMAELYDTTRQNIGQHIDGIFQDGELDRAATVKKFFIVRPRDVKGIAKFKRG